MVIHPAHQMPFDQLVTGLQTEINKGNINTRSNNDGLIQYTYTKNCVFGREWNKFTEIARGIILDHEAKTIVGTPFTKFYNFGEQSMTWPTGEFETFEKVDGSLIIVFFHNGKWQTATKGSFFSEQAKKAKSFVNAFSVYLLKGHTYLFEYVGPSNRIVVKYYHEELILLGAYLPDGEEYPSWRITSTARLLRVRPMKYYFYKSFIELKDHVDSLPAQEEGFVVRFSSGLRLKLKGEEYCRIHRCISRVTPLAIWEAMREGQNLDEFKSMLPEEFWTDFHSIVDLISLRYEARMKTINIAKATTDDFVDRDLIKAGLPKDLESMVRVLRKGPISDNPKAVRALYEFIRPKANNLPGYEPSTSINRFEEEL
jgi:RNA ligase